MKDMYGRKIDYLRISITDRCNLRCQYCMPNGVIAARHEEIFRYEELLEICKCAISLGIVKFKITGGEPFARKGAVDFIRQLKQLEGVESVTLTTNGICLKQHIEELRECKIDGINISLDTTDRERYEEITGFDCLSQVLDGIRASVEAGILTKLNVVLLENNKDTIKEMALFAKQYPMDVRFIELMPIGVGKCGGGFSPAEARRMLLEEYEDLHPVEEIRGNGPAHYEASAYLQGRIGWIDAVSHTFCESCNRVRLTSIGLLKPCLCYGETFDLKEIIRGDEPIEEKRKRIREQLQKAIFSKPKEHCFSEQNEISEQKKMVEIGG